MKTWHLLTPEYPPLCGGVGDYTALVAAGLAGAGDEVHVWHPPGPDVQSGNGLRLTVHRLPDRFGRESRRLVTAALAAAPGIVVAQYVPAAFGVRGLNLAFCHWMSRLRRGGADVRVMFHEPFFYFGASRPWRNVFAVGQRVMAAMLLRASTRVYYSTETWTRLLARYGRPSCVEVLPIPSTIPREVAPEAVVAARSTHRAEFVIGHFGSYGEHVGGELRDLLPALLRVLPASRVLLVGGGGEAFAGALPPDVRDRVDATGRLSGLQAAAALRACDLLVQPYPDGVTTRRTSVMSGLTTGVPVLTSSGALTESVWARSSAVALAPAGDVKAFVAAAARLSTDPRERAALGARGLALYDAEFALDITIERMRR